MSLNFSLRQLLPLLLLVLQRFKQLLEGLLINCQPKLIHYLQSQTIGLNFLLDCVPMIRIVVNEKSIEAYLPGLKLKQLMLEVTKPIRCFDVLSCMV